MYACSIRVYARMCACARACVAVRLCVMRGEVISTHVQLLQRGEAGQGVDDRAGTLLTECRAAESAGSPPHTEKSRGIQGNIGTPDGDSRGNVGKM